MNKLFTLLLMVWMSGLFVQSKAQATYPGSISGTIKDSLSTEPIPYASAALKQGDKIISGTVTDEAGFFKLSNLPLGDYSLEISYLGYQSSTIAVKLTASQPTLSLQHITLKSNSKMLEGVEIITIKDLVEDKGDKLVYNAEKDISNAGGTAADVLRKVPTLSVDMEGNVQMRGNSNIKVLINGKPSAMMARNLADALKQMPSDVVKSVEVITSPGAKYDAEGSAGVINIITKKGLQGFNGSTNLTAGDLNKSIGTNLNYRRNKIGISFSANGYQNRNIWEIESSRTSLKDGAPTTILSQRSYADNVGKGGYGELSLDYDPDSTTHLNFSLNVWGGNFPSNSTLLSRMTDPAGRELAAFRNESRYRNPFGNGQMDLGYTKSFKKEGQELSVLTQFSRMPDNYVYDVDTYSGADEITFRQHSINFSRNKEYTAQADYVHPFKIYGSKDTTNLKLELGAKTILRDIGSEFRVELAQAANSPFVPDPAQSNDFDYFQRVYSGYTSLRLNTKSKWNINAGARLEHTDIQGKFISTNTPLYSNYTNLIPSINISKGIKEHHFKLAYTQRIQRPLIWYLNPWVNARDTLNISTGNPYLNPELNHGLELAHSLSTDKGLSLNSALYWRYTDNAIEYVATVNDKGVSVSMPQNIALRKNYGLNINLSSKLNKSWTLNGGIDLRFVDLSSPALRQSNQGFIWNTHLNSTYNLPRNYSIQVNGSMNSGWITLQNRNSGFYWYAIAAKKEFWDKKGSLTLGLNNPFNRGVKQSNVRSAPSFYAEGSHFSVNRSVRLTFSWRFGQMTDGGGKKGKKIRNDDTGGR